MGRSEHSLYHSGKNHQSKGKGTVFKGGHHETWRTDPDCPVRADFRREYCRGPIQAQLVLKRVLYVTLLWVPLLLPEYLVLLSE